MRRPQSKSMPGFTVGKLLLPIAVIGLAISAQAFAQGGDPDRHQQGQHEHADHHQHYKVKAYHRPSGYQAHEWKHGDRLPPAYRNRRYVVDYRSYRLSAPPQGYEWVRVDNNAVMVAITTGVVASVVAGLFYQQ